MSKVLSGLRLGGVFQPWTSSLANRWTSGDFSPAGPHSACEVPRVYLDAWQIATPPAPAGQYHMSAIAPLRRATKSASVSCVAISIAGC